MLLHVDNVYDHKNVLLLYVIIVQQRYSFICNASFICQWTIMQITELISEACNPDALGSVYTCMYVCIYIYLNSIQFGTLCHF